MEKTNTENIQKPIANIVPVEWLPDDLVEEFNLSVGGAPSTIFTAPVKRVVEVDGEKVGFCTAKPWNGPNRLVVEGIYVQKKHEREGLGTKLVQDIHNIAVKKGFMGLHFSEVNSSVRRIVRRQCKTTWKDRGYELQTIPADEGPMGEEDLVVKFPKKKSVHSNG